MAAMSVGGLASGLDTNSIIAQLTALEQSKVTREEDKKERAKNTLEKFNEVETKLMSLESKAKTLDLPKTFNAFKSTSNYDDIAIVLGGDGATAGQYELQVFELATTQKVASNTFEKINSPMSENAGWENGTEKVTISLSLSAAAKKADPTKGPVDVTINASDTLKDIVNKINAAEGSGVKASLMTMANGENRLVLTAVDTGTKGFYITEPSGSGFLTNVLGVTTDKEKYTTDGAFLTKTGAASEETTFGDIDTGLGKNDFDKDDVMSVKIGNTTISASLWDIGTNGFKTIQDVLAELNEKLQDPDYVFSVKNPDPRPIEPKEPKEPIEPEEPEEPEEPTDTSDPDFQDAYDKWVEDHAKWEEDHDQWQDEHDQWQDEHDQWQDEHDQWQDEHDQWEIDNAAYPEFVDAQGVYPGLTLSLNSSGEVVLTGWPDEGPKPASEKEMSKDMLTASERAMMTLFEIKIGKDDGAGGIVGKAKKEFGGVNVGNIFKNEINTAQNAFYTLDGMAIGSQSNKDDKTIVGTTFELKKADPDKTVKVSLDLDKGALADKIADFISELNTLIMYLEENSKAKVVEETDKDTGKKVSKREVGVFSGDSNISALRDNLRRMLTGTINEIAGLMSNGYDSGYKTVYSSAARIGITTAQDGSLSIDREKLNKALDADLEGVRKLFTANSFSSSTGFDVGRFSKDSPTGIYSLIKDDEGEWTVSLNGRELSGIRMIGNNMISTEDGITFEIPTNAQPGEHKVTFIRGIAAQLSNFVEKARSSVSGYFKETKKTYQNRIDEVQKRIDQLQVRVNNYNTRLIAQFSALERSMSSMQAQSANMMSALGGIR